MGYESMVCTAFVGLFGPLFRHETLGEGPGHEICTYDVNDQVHIHFLSRGSLRRAESVMQKRALRVTTPLIVYHVAI